MGREKNWRLAEAGGFRLVLTSHRESGVNPTAVVIDAVTANVVQMCRVTYGPDFNPTLNEITSLLGLSEISSFSRSFKHWTGMAPTV